VAAPAEHEGESRPRPVTVGLLLAYLEGVAFVALGGRDPNSTGGVSGLAFIVLGVLVLSLATYTRTGSRLARACLLVPLVGAGAVLVRQDYVWYLRAVPVVSAAVIVVLLLLAPSARRFFGDDATPVRAR